MNKKLAQALNGFMGPLLTRRYPTVGFGGFVNCTGGFMNWR